MNELKEPIHFKWDERLPDADKDFLVELNAALDAINGKRAVQITRSGPFARSKIAWKLAGYQHALLHRIVALTDGAAVAWNNRCTLSAMLSARALMETFAVIAEVEHRVRQLLVEKDLGGLDALAQGGVFASRDPELIKENPEIKAVNVLTYVQKFDKRIEGFLSHYDRLSERCHPNAPGHNFMFAKLDRTDATIDFTDKRNPEWNGHMIFVAFGTLPLTGPISDRLHQLILQVADYHHSVAPVGGSRDDTAAS
jgi:hypothetical protein